MEFHQQRPCTRRDGPVHPYETGRLPVSAFVWCRTVPVEDLLHATDVTARPTECVTEAVSTT